jgi:hypothetical protein
MAKSPEATKLIGDTPLFSALLIALLLLDRYGHGSMRPPGL